MKFQLSIRLRIALWYVAVLAVVLIAFSAGIYFFLRKNLNDSMDDSLRNRASVLVNVIATSDSQSSLQGFLLAEDPNDRESYIRSFDATGQVTFDTSEKFGTVPVDSAGVQTALAGGPVFRTISDPDLRSYTFPVKSNGEVIGAIEIGQSRDDMVDTFNTLIYVLAVAYPVTLIGASVGGLFLAGRALSPIDRLTRRAQRISAQNLDERFNLDAPDDELGRLARTFDEMIARLDEAFKRQRQFTADASHELRTPLTVLKGQLDVALNRNRSAESYRQMLESARDEVDHMIRLVGSLLTLARADADRINLRKEAIDLGAIVEGAVEQFRPAASAKGISLTIQPGPDVQLHADEDLILQLVLNLLDNAIEHTPADGRVEATWKVADHHAALTVTDSGVGIAPEHVPHLFDRFYRVERNRGRSDGGAGLGLAICRWIAEAHGGSITVQSMPQTGSRFDVELPLPGPENAPSD
jgi:heavy metal sensor kinase